jgi:hypothetical protein
LILSRAATGHPCFAKIFVTSFQPTSNRYGDGTNLDQSGEKLGTGEPASRAERQSRREPRPAALSGGAPGVRSSAGGTRGETFSGAGSEGSELQFSSELLAGAGVQRHVPRACARKVRRCMDFPSRLPTEALTPFADPKVRRCMDFPS